MLYPVRDRYQTQCQEAVGQLFWFQEAVVRQKDSRMLQLKHKFGLNYLYDKNKNLFPSGLTPIFILLKYAIENLILNVEKWNTK